MFSGEYAPPRCGLKRRLRYAVHGTDGVYDSGSPAHWGTGAFQYPSVNRMARELLVMLRHLGVEARTFFAFWSSFGSIPYSLSLEVSMRVERGRTYVCAYFFGEGCCLRSFVVFPITL